MKEYIAHITLRYPTFVISDIIGTAKIYSIPLEFADPAITIGVEVKTPFIIVKFASDEDAKIVAEHCISIRSISTHITTTDTLDETLKILDSYEHDLNMGSFAVKIEHYNRKTNGKEKLEMINKIIKSLRMTSTVDLKNPDNTLALFLEYEYEGKVDPIKVHFGVKIAEGIPDFPDKFNVKKRKFINKTTMEATVALYSAVQGLAAPGKIIYDPFCGSGSLLVAAASLGACVFGSDLDMKAMTLQGYGENAQKGFSIPSNFEQYGLTKRLLGLIRLDFLTETLKPDLKLDAIVTDPPYGIRERCVAETRLSPLHPLLLRLYAVAARSLRVGGRLVFWLPCDYDLDADRDLPKHPALKLVSNCRQPLSSRYCRHLIALEKTAEIDAPVEFDNMEASWLRVHDLVFEPTEKRNARLGKPPKPKKRHPKREE